MSIYLLGDDPGIFPPSELALEDPNGLLAAGGDLSVPRLLTAYSLGIFPWFQDDQPILWWTPSPRLVLYPGECHVSRSMAKWLKRVPWNIKIDSAFESVIHHCAGPRQKADGTWITDEMKEAYVELHRLGFAHSFEVFEGDELIGGLYGIGLGKVFFGESMFSHKSNASKTAFIAFARFLRHQRFELIDCQVKNSHLLTLGTREIPRKDFEKHLSSAILESTIHETQALWQQVKGKVISADGHLSD